MNSYNCLEFKVKEGRKYYRMIRAYIGKEYIGYYRLKKVNHTPIFPNDIVMTSKMESFVSNKGILRGLITKATELLGIVAKLNKQHIEHHVTFADEDSRFKLRHILLEKGYTQIGDNLFVRIYKHYGSN